MARSRSAALARCGQRLVPPGRGPRAHRRASAARRRDRSRDRSTRRPRHPSGRDLGVGGRSAEQEGASTKDVALDEDLPVGDGRRNVQRIGEPEEPLRLVLRGDGGAQAGCRAWRPTRRPRARPGRPAHRAACARRPRDFRRTSPLRRSRARGWRPSQPSPWRSTTSRQRRSCSRESGASSPAARDADHQQGVPGAARDRLAEAEQVALGRLGEAAERERPVGCGADDVRRSLRGLAQAARRRGHGAERGRSTACERAMRPRRNSRYSSAIAASATPTSSAHGGERVDRALRLVHGRVDLAIGGRAVDPVREQLDRRPQRVALRSGRAALGDGVGQQQLGLRRAGRSRSVRPPDWAAGPDGAGRIPAATRPRGRGDRGW